MNVRAPSSPVSPVSRVSRVTSLRAALAIGALSIPLAAQSQVDLSTWTAESYAAVSGFGAGRWTVASGGGSVVQSVNGQPTLFYSDFEVSNLRIEGELVPGSGDDDYLGFALGFRPGDSTNPGADYLLVDWKKATQGFNFGAPSCTPGSTAQIGLAVSRVRGIPTADEFWGHVDLDASPCSTPADRVTELARGTNLGSTGWVSGRTYRFRFDFTPTQLVVFVDGVQEMSINGRFDGGRMAFYNFSQANVTYRAFTSACPASKVSYGQGHPGTGGVPGIDSDALPVLGTSIGLQLGNAARAAAPDALFLGLAQDRAATPFGGTLLVQPMFSVTLLLPIGGATLPLQLPNDPASCGVGVYLQHLHLDAGASAGLAFSRGLELVLGT